MKRLSSHKRTRKQKGAVIPVGSIRAGLTVADAHPT